jgi:outer membrane protein assembly factor BamB
MIRNRKKVIIISILLVCIFFNPQYYVILNKDQNKVSKNDFNKELKNSATISEFWSFRTHNKVWSSPAVGDINNDGKLEIVIGSLDNNIYAINGEDGDELWRYYTGDDIYSSPALGDIDGDGKLEVVIGSYDKNIYALNGEDGGKLWNYTTGGLLFASPSLGDIDDDGKLEVIIGSKDHIIYALNGEDGSELWNFPTGDFIYCSPALGDLDGDGKLEVVIGSYDNNIYALNGEDGSKLWNYTTYEEIYASPALGDVNGDGKLEVIIADLHGWLYCLNGEDGSIIWYCFANHPIYSSPALGDIDNDGKLEIVTARWSDKLYAINGEDGSTLWYYDLGWSLYSSPALGDLDGDGKLEVLIPDYPHPTDEFIFQLSTINGEDGSSSWNYTISNKAFYSSPALADLDNDEKLEIIIGSTDCYVYAIKSEPSGKEICWQGFSGDNDFNRRRCHRVLPPLDLDVLFSWSKIYKFKHITNELKISIIKSTQKNDELLSRWQVIPDENYNFKFGLLIELSNLDSALEFYGAPQFITDLCNKFLLSEDGALRIFLSLNIIKAYVNWTLNKFASNIKTLFLTFIKLGLHPNRKVSLDVAFRWLIDNPIGEKYFHIVRGTNQYQLKLLPSAQKNPIWALLKVLDIFVRGDFYILNINSQNLTPFRISSHEIVKHVKFIIDIWKFVTKCGRVIASAGADVAAWIQGGASAYKIFHQVIFDPPSILESILNRIFPDYSTKIEEIFGEFKKISDWIYLGASFLDPPTSRLDLGVFDSNGKLLLGYNKTNGHLIYS